MTRNHKANLGLVAVGAVLGLSGLIGLFLAIFGIENLVWPMLLFEPVVIGGGVLIVCVGLGIQRSNLPMALATAAGCVAVAGFLSTVAGRNSLGSGVLVPLMGLRLLAALAFGIYATWLVLGPNREAWRRLVLGAALTSAGAVVAASAFIGPTKPIREWFASLGGFVNSAAALVLFVAFVVLIAAGIHLMVRPFEMALDTRKPQGPPAS